MVVVRSGSSTSITVLCTGDVGGCGSRSKLHFPHGGGGLMLYMKNMTLDFFDPSFLSASFNDFSQFYLIVVVLLILLCSLILTRVWWDLQVTNLTGLHLLHGEIGEGFQAVSNILEWIQIVWLLEGKSVSACVDSFWIATSCSWMFWLDYCLLLFYKELMDRGSFLYWQTIHTSFLGILVILLIDMRMYGVERVVNACCRCCRELMVLWTCA